MAGRRKQTRINKVASKDIPQFSVGKYSSFNINGTIEDPVRNGSATDAKVRMANKMRKSADLWAGENGPANISDSENIGYYSYEFPVDALELPQSRAQELRFYRLAYDRDPIVGRGIDLHTEIPMNKINLDRPKC